MSGSAFTVREANWHSEADSLRAIRQAVFVLEQGVSADLEFEADDDQHRHVIALDLNGQPIGTGRISSSGKIGRMAVLKMWRSQGVGSSILEKLIEIANTNGITTLCLSAQLHALPFYRRHGFIEEGETYLEAGIEHRRMKS